MAKADDETNTSRHPAMGAVPPARHLTACEVLNWIGYRRAIPSAVYFAPVRGAAPGAMGEQLAGLLHSAVPDPKPAECPMAAAESKLMEALRARRVRALAEKDGRLEELPDEIYEYAVAANARGSIEPDSRATSADSFRALKYLSSLPSIGPLLFSTAQVMAEWPSRVTVPEEDTAAEHNPRGPRPRKAGGPKRVRKGRYDWSQALETVSADLHAHGIPQDHDGGQARLERLAAAAFPPDAAPAESVIRARVASLIAAHRKAVNEGR